MQPGSGKGPQSVGGAGRNSDCFGSVRDTEAHKISELYQPRGLWIGVRQLCQSVIQGDQVFLNVVGHDSDFMVPDFVESGSAFELPATASVLHQNPPHGLGCRSKKVSSAVPLLSVVHIEQSDERIGPRCGKSRRQWSCADGTYLSSAKGQRSNGPRYFAFDARSARTWL